MATKLTLKNTWVNRKNLFQDQCQIEGLEFWYVIGLLTWAPVSADLFCLCVQ